MRIKLLRSIGRTDELLRTIPEPAQAELLAAVEGNVIEATEKAADVLIERGLAEKTTEEVTKPKMAAKPVK